MWRSTHKICNGYVLGVFRSSVMGLWVVRICFIAGNLWRVYEDFGEVALNLNLLCTFLIREWKEHLKVSIFLLKIYSCKRRTVTKILNSVHSEMSPSWSFCYCEFGLCLRGFSRGRRGRAGLAVTCPPHSPDPGTCCTTLSNTKSGSTWVPPVFGDEPVEPQVILSGKDLQEQRVQP